MSREKSRPITNFQQTKTVSLRLPKILVDWMDALIDSGIYSARAEIIREFSREYLREYSNTKRSN